MSVDAETLEAHLTKWISLHRPTTKDYGAAPNIEHVRYLFGVEATLDQILNQIEVFFNRGLPEPTRPKIYNPADTSAIKDIIMEQ